ncbi:hypothetical protein AAG906_031643 [Vitis piasezkii]
MYASGPSHFHKDSTTSEPSALHYLRHHHPFPLIPMNTLHQPLDFQPTSQINTIRQFQPQPLLPLLASALLQCLGPLVFAIVSTIVKVNLSFPAAWDSLLYFIYSQSVMKTMTDNILISSSLISLGCLTFWCPCVTFGRIAEIVDRGSTSCGVSGALYTLILCLTGCSCLYSCFYRSKLRGQYLLEESPCVDCCVHCWCEGCALCQEYRELQNRGFDLSIGWHGNMERQRRGGVDVNPVVPEGSMTR